MKNPYAFTMHPDMLFKIPCGGKRHAGQRDRMLVLAYLVRAFGYPDMHQWKDLTIQQIAGTLGMSRWTASDHFNQIVDHWLDGGYMVHVEGVWGGKVDIVQFYQYIKKLQDCAKTRVPKRSPKGLRLVEGRKPMCSWQH
jgi:hypothetical protein